MIISKWTKFCYHCIAIKHSNELFEKTDEIRDIWSEIKSETPKHNGIISIIVKLNLETGSQTGVVIVNKVSVKSGLDSSNTTLFELHEGALVKITEERKNWFEIRLNEKQKGWVPKDTLGAWN